MWFYLTINSRPHGRLLSFNRTPLHNSVNYSIQVAVPPAEECVTAEELYDHLNLNVALPAVEDLLNLYITTARETFESLTDGRIVCATTFVQRIPDFPRCAGTPVKLYRGEVLAVEEITYYDADDVQQTLSGWAVDISGIPALVSMPEGGFPSVSKNIPRPVSITFTAGWPYAESVPESIRLAIMLLASHFYNVREAFSEINLVDVPLGFRRICDQWKTGIGDI